MNPGYDQIAPARINLRPVATAAGRFTSAAPVASAAPQVPVRPSSLAGK
jgi:hypothetical protein